MSEMQIAPATDPNSIVVANIKTLMKDQRWTGRKMATALGLLPTYVHRRLSGVTPMDPNDLVLFAGLLEVSVGSLFEMRNEIHSLRDGGVLTRIQFGSTGDSIAA